MAYQPRSLDTTVKALQQRWREYQEAGTFDRFVEFALALNSVTDQLNRLRLPGLLRQSEGLENAALALFGDPGSHPVDSRHAAALDRQLETLIRSIETASPPARTSQRHGSPVIPAQPKFAAWSKPRTVWVVCAQHHPWFGGLAEQLSFFGFRVYRLDWQEAASDTFSPLVVLFIPDRDGYGDAELEFMQRLRERHATSQFFCLAVPNCLDDMVKLLRAGADAAIQAEQQTTTVLARVLELVQSQEQEPYRVLLVEDSRTAVAMIQRSLSQHGIESRSIGNPQELLAAVEQYRPDLVLMDMYMPHCTGVEATRVLRQLSAHQSLPVVYLSSETDMGLQVEALRLGGDQFLTKPCNPVFLAAVVKTKIERYREMRRASQHDSLTGLLNHSAAKTRLNQLVKSLDPRRDFLCVAMLDIDHFKSVNDTYGHPVGDQVIRSLAWLLQGRLRASDLIGRYGGEEFIVVLRGIGMGDAVAILDRIRHDFSGLPHAHGNGILCSTFSAGIAAYPACTTGNELTQAADNALLQAKRLGRNRIELAHD